MSLEQYVKSLSDGELDALIRQAAKEHHGRKEARFASDTRIRYFRDPKTGERVEHPELPSESRVIWVQVGFHKDDLIDKFVTTDFFPVNFHDSDFGHACAFYGIAPPRNPDGSIPPPHFFCDVTNLVAWKYNKD